MKKVFIFIIIAGMASIFEGAAGSASSSLSDFGRSAVAYAHIFMRNAPSESLVGGAVGMVGGSMATLASLRARKLYDRMRGPTSLNYFLRREIEARPVDFVICVISDSKKPSRDREVFISKFVDLIKKNPYQARAFTTKDFKTIKREVEKQEFSGDVIDQLAQVIAFKEAKS